MRRCHQLLFGLDHDESSLWCLLFAGLIEKRSQAPDSRTHVSMSVTFPRGYAAMCSLLHRSPDKCVLFGSIASRKPLGRISVQVESIQFKQLKLLVDQNPTRGGRLERGVSYSPTWLR